MASLSVASSFSHLTNMIRQLSIAGLLLATSLLPLASTSTVHAAASKHDLAVARQLFAQAARFERVGNWKQALVRLRRVVAIKETAGIRYHIGVCLEHLGELVEALDNYEQAKSLAADGSAPDVARMVPGKIEQLRSKLVMVTVRGDLEGEHEVVVRVDESPALLHIEMGKPFALTPKLHRFVVQVDGRVRMDRFIDEKAGSKVDLVLKVRGKRKKSESKPVRKTVTNVASKPESTSPSDSAPQSEGSGGHSTLGWVLAGAGVAMGVGGVASYMQAGAVADDSQTACLDAVQCDPKRAEVVRQWDSAALGLWIGAAVSVGVGVSLVLMSGGGEGSGEAQTDTSLILNPSSVAIRTTF